MTTNNDFQAFKTALARIYHANGNVVGAGFLVSERHLLTCAYVVAAALSIPQNSQEMPQAPIILDFPLIEPGKKVQSKVVFWQPVNPLQSGEDIAGLELQDSPPRGIQPVNLLAAEDYWQHNFRIFGFPIGHDLGIWATGTLRDKRANGWLQLDAIFAQDRAVEKGFSGAPVWDESLQGVIGMAVAAEKRREDVTAAFMIPTQILTQAWSILKQPPKLMNQTNLERDFNQIKDVEKQKFIQQIQLYYEDFYQLQNIFSLNQETFGVNFLSRVAGNDPYTKTVNLTQELIKRKLMNEFVKICRKDYSDFATDL